MKKMKMMCEVLVTKKYWKKVAMSSLMLSHCFSNSNMVFGLSSLTNAVMGRRSGKAALPASAVNKSSSFFVNEKKRK